jgi:hypothetical protein
MHDDKGRLSARLDLVELAEQVTFTDEQLALMLSKPSTLPSQLRRKQERVAPSPGEITLPDMVQKFFSQPEAKAYALGAVQQRDRQWAQYLANLDSRKLD